MCYRVARFNLAPYSLPSRFRELRLMKDVEQFIGLRRVQVEAVATHELQCVPRLRVVPRRDRDAAVGIHPLDRELQARRRTDAEVNRFAARGEKTGEHSRARHRPRRARVAADEYAARVEVRAEPLREADDQLRREGFADDAAHSADADFERVHNAGREDSRKESDGSLKTFSRAAGRVFMIAASRFVRLALKEFD